MSLFCMSGMTQQERKDLMDAIECIAKHINSLSDRIDALEVSEKELCQELAKMKEPPRMSLAQKLRGKA